MQKQIALRGESFRSATRGQIWNAATSLRRIARIHKDLDTALVIPKPQALKSDQSIASSVQTALDDLKWVPSPPITVQDPAIFGALTPQNFCKPSTTPSAMPSCSRPWLQSQATRAIPQVSALQKPRSHRRPKFADTSRKPAERTNHLWTACASPHETNTRTSRAHSQSATQQSASARSKTAPHPPTS